MQVAVLAGGLATRLYPLTQSIPKSMVRIEGKPFLQYQLELLAAHGVHDVVLCVGHLAQQIHDCFGDGSHLGVQIVYSDEEEQALGTAGALKYAKDVLADQFFVLFGDSYLMLDYAHIWDHFIRRDRLGLMVVYRNEGRYDTSDVLVEDGLVTAYDKASPLPGMVYINEGLSVVRKAALNLIPSQQQMSLQKFFGRLIEQRQLLALETRQRFYEIGSPAGLEEFKQLVTSGGIAS
jgi:NDP-sugar pyrophosphorylase family protein